MSLFSPFQIRLQTTKPADEVRYVLSQWAQESPTPSCHFLAGDLQEDRFELRWFPPARRATALAVEGRIREELDTTYIDLAVTLSPSQQASRLIWLGLLGVLFFITLFGPPPPWLSIFPLGAMIMLYVNHETGFSTSQRNLRAFLIEHFDAELRSV